MYLFELSHMNLTLKEMFLRLWEEYYDDAELPIVFYILMRKKSLKMFLLLLASV